MNWPSISIIIPSFNQGSFIERTILSILRQEYAGEVQVIVSDGGSKDETVAILKKYPQIVWWSEPDKGFVDAVTKGIAAAKGEVLAIQSSDDFYLKGAFARSVGELLQDSNIGIIAGSDLYLQADRKRFTASPLGSGPITPRSLLKERTIPQHCAFFYRHVADKIGGLRQEVDICADVDLWYRALHFFKGKFIPYHTAVYQLHANQRTQVLHGWYAGLRQMIELCERDPFYAEQFTLSAADKEDLYLRWKLWDELQHGDKAWALQTIDDILNDAQQGSDLKQYASSLRANSGETTANGWLAILRDGRLAKKISKRVKSLFEAKPDINWWQS